MTEQLVKYGYTGKHLQFYARPRPGTDTVCVYRCLLSKRNAWITIPESEDNSAYLKKGCCHKTHRYYGIESNEPKALENGGFR